MTFPAVRDGRVVKDLFPSGLPKFDLRLRLQYAAADFLPTSACAQAIALLFDSDGSTATFYFDLYQRSASFFDDSELSAYHRAGRRARARAAWRPYPDAVRPDVLDGTWSPPDDRRLRPRPRRPAQGARAVSRRRLRAQRHDAARARQRPAVQLRDHGHQPGRGAPGAGFFQQPRAAPASTRKCAWSTPCNTISAGCRLTST